MFRFVHCAIFSSGPQQPLPRMASALQPPQSVTHSLLAFALAHHHILHSITFLKSTASSRPSVSVPRCCSHKCLRFGLWLTPCTIRILFTYLHTYLLKCCNLCMALSSRKYLLLCFCFKVDCVGGLQFGDKGKLYLVRFLNSCVMVRVGGGWETLPKFLENNDPCRGSL